MQCVKVLNKAQVKRSQRELCKQHNSMATPTRLQVNTRMYDVTDFPEKHPGGAEIINAWKDGDDITEAFREFHHGMDLPHEFLQELSSTRAPPPPHPQESTFMNEIGHLRRIFVMEGLFRPSMAYYTRKCVELFGLLAVGYVFRSAFVLGLAMQQAGWLGHDIIHRQVARGDTARRALSLVVGAFILGMTPSWWKRKHSLHHAKPNVEGVDQDIDTKPVVDWFPSSTSYQHIYLWCLLPFTKVSWSLQSLMVEGTLLEKALVVLHYVMFLKYVGWTVTLMTEIWAGFLISVVFIQSHTGLAPPGEGGTQSFYASQIHTSRNISPDAFTTWLTGGLNYQIEHHMFPSLPRHAYSAVAPRVRALCVAKGLPYRCEKSLMSSTFEVMRHLHGT